jgi:hypothetical protein
MKDLERTLYLIRNGEVLNAAQSARKLTKAVFRNAGNQTPPMTLLFASLLIIAGVTWFRVIYPPLPEPKKKPTEDSRGRESEQHQGDALNRSLRVNL